MLGRASFRDGLPLSSACGNGFLRGDIKSREDLGNLWHQVAAIDAQLKVGSLTLRATVVDGVAEPASYATAAIAGPDRAIAGQPLEESVPHSELVVRAQVKVAQQVARDASEREAKALERAHQLEVAVSEHRHALQADEQRAMQLETVVVEQRRALRAEDGRAADCRRALMCYSDEAHRCAQAAEAALEMAAAERSARQSAEDAALELAAEGAALRGELGAATTLANRFRQEASHYRTAASDSAEAAKAWAQYADGVQSKIGKSGVGGARVPSSSSTCGTPRFIAVSRSTPRAVACSGKAESEPSSLKKTLGGSSHVKTGDHQDLSDLHALVSRLSADADRGMAREVAPARAMSVPRAAEPAASSFAQQVQGICGQPASSDAAARWMLRSPALSSTPSAAAASAAGGGRTHSSWLAATGKGGSWLRTSANAFPTNSAS